MKSFSFLATMILPLLLSAQVQFTKPKHVWVLSIGISKYNNVEVKDLSFPTNDAQVFSNTIHEILGSRLVYNKVLLDRDANYEQIKRELNIIAQSAEQDDEIIIFISSHGIINYALLHERQYLAYSEVNEILSKSKSKLIFVIVDACHSGSSLNINSSKIFYLNSCLEHEQSFEFKNVHHGLFSYFLIIGIKGAADLNLDSSITTNELHEYVSLKMNYQTSILGIKQSPYFTNKNIRIL